MYPTRKRGTFIKTISSKISYKHTEIIDKMSTSYFITVIYFSKVYCMGMAVACSELFTLHRLRIDWSDLICMTFSEHYSGLSADFSKRNPPVADYWAALSNKNIMHLFYWFSRIYKVLVLLFVWVHFSKNFETVQNALAIAHHERSDSSISAIRP